MKLLYIDLFCGAGGTSTGIEAAQMDSEQCAKVIACVNHDANAIASHASNHPSALHFVEDIRTLELSPLLAHLAKCKVKYPDASIVLWASLECTNFSRAKGGKARDADSRTLAEHLFRYIEAINPDYIQIENVEEFMTWGDLDENGRPVSKDKGRLYTQWVENVKSYGYNFDHRILNSADYGAYTSRKRFFGIFAKHGLPISFPDPTHFKQPSTWQQAWKPVGDVLDFNDEGNSIFDRKKPLVDKSLERIYAGLVKFVAGGKEAFMVKYNSMNKGGKYHAPGIDSPCPVVSTQNRLGMACVNFLSKQFGGTPAGKNIGVSGPAGTITTIDHHAFISVHYGNGYVKPVNMPAPTVTTKDRFALVSPVPLKGWRYLMNPQFSSAGGSVEKPCFTLIARMDKMPPYLVKAATSGQCPSFIKMREGRIVYEICDTDSEVTRKIKEFMALYGIMDVKMRMLKVPELKRIMGFPENYMLIGTQAEQKKFIGNAVEVNMARVLCEALYKALSNQRAKVA
jgi:DNA (cytosine-5)-methyltransferase 1